MAPIDKSTITQVLENGPTRSLIGGKQLTLAFGGLYIASTTLQAKPLLIWEGESGYARYYVPIESLHPSIKTTLGGDGSGANGGHDDSSKKVKLETVEEVKGKNDSAAVIETLTVGERSTTWVRFTEGLLKGFVRFEPKEIDAWFENGAIFMGIKNPYKRIDTKPVADHVIVKIDGEVVAETTAPVILNETGLKDAYYIPATSVKDWGALEKSEWRTACPYKGEAWYYSITVNGKKHENAIWYYPYPTHESAGVEGFFSFYNREGTDIIVDGIKLTDLNRGSGIKAVSSGSGMRHAVPNDGSLDIPWSKL